MTNVRCLAAFLACTVCLLTAAEPAEPVPEFPTIEKLIVRDTEAQIQVYIEFFRAQGHLARQLMAIIGTNDGSIENSVRARACYMLARLRDPSADVIMVMIKHIEENLLPIEGGDMPGEYATPADVLIAIGRPATYPVLQALERQGSAERQERLLWVLRSLEGDEAVARRLERHVHKERPVEDAATDEMRDNLRDALARLADLHRKDPVGGLW